MRRATPKSSKPATTAASATGSRPQVIRQQTESGVIDLEHLEMDYHPGAQASCRAKRRRPPGSHGEIWHLKSDRGQVRAEWRRRELNGNVRVTGPPPGTGAPLSLTTETMRINTPTEFIETDAPGETALVGPRTRRAWACRPI